jgi:nitric oxide reductase NorD protein
VRAAPPPARAALRRLLARAARTTARAARALRPPAPPPDDVVALDDVRRRLELLLAGLHGRAIRVDAVEAPPRRGLARRALGAAARVVFPARAAAAAADARLPRLLGATVRLPPTLRGDAALDAAARYRVLALVQGERLARGAERWCPRDDAVARALFLLREGAATDRAVARRVRGALPALHALRAEALAARPAPEALPHGPREVELLLREALAPGALHLGVAPRAEEDGPEASLAWARETARRLRDETARDGGARRRAALPPVAHWGRAAEPRADDDDGSPEEAPVVVGDRVDSLHARLPLPAPGARARVAEELEGRRRAGVARPEAGPGGMTGGVDHMPEAPREGPRPGEGERLPDATVVTPEFGTLDRRVAHAGATADYPEWDAYAGRYVPRAATVLLDAAPEGDGAWAERVLRDHAALVRRVRHRFEPLRANRARLPRQRQGDQLDVAACVEGRADRAAGHPGDDRLYLDVQPARRALAIVLLVDTSGSTDARVSTARGDARQIIDVEKEALLLAGEALDALGDPFAVLTFSSRGARAVRVHAVKGFAERHDAAVRRRVAALAPGGNTRLGAAVRHASALLARQPAGHRLLLLLSDGRPNDMDRYQGRYAVEDARQAVHEARARGIFPFCLTVDREESEYLPHIFGAAGHTVLRRPDQLPLALVRAVRQLLGAGAR